MQRSEVSGAVRPLWWSLSVKGLIGLKCGRLTAVCSMYCHRAGLRAVSFQINFLSHSMNAHVSTWSLLYGFTLSHRNRTLLNILLVHNTLTRRVNWILLRCVSGCGECAIFLSSPYVFYHTTSFGNMPTFRRGLTHDWGLSATVSWLLYYIDGNLLPRLAFSSYQGVSHSHHFEPIIWDEDNWTRTVSCIKTPQHLAAFIV